MKRWFGVGGEPFGILDQCKIMTSIPGVADSSAKKMTLDCHFPCASAERSAAGFEDSLYPAVPREALCVRETFACE